jgi:hypothetical protein
VAWWPGIDRKQISQGAGGKPRILFIDPEVGWIDLRDWSGDGKWLAVTLTRGADRTAQIGLVSAADGSLRVLKSVDWGRERPSKMAFSPDGKVSRLRHPYAQRLPAA